MDAVRVFAGDGGLQLECSELKQYAEGSEWSHRKIYVVDEVQTEQASWTVDAMTGEAIRACHYDAYPDEQSWDTPLGPLTQEACRQIAEDFARSKYSGFETVGLHLNKQEWTGEGWSFDWQQKITHDAWTPNHVRVDVNPTDGRIQGYGCRRIPTPTPPAPQITAAQAIDAVKVGKGFVTVLQTESSSLFATPDGISWVLMGVQGNDAEGVWSICNARVDAVSGEVLSISEPWGSPSSAGSSVTAGESTSIRDLAAKVPGAKVHWLGKDGAKVFVGKERYMLVPGKDTIESTGGTIKLSAKIKLVDGRLMVPSGLLDILKSASAPKKARQSAAR